MNLKEARKLQPGAIVREAWDTSNRCSHGIVLSKQHVVEDHVANVLCQKKKERFDVQVHWLASDPATRHHSYGREKQGTIQKCQSWEIMVVSHA